MTCGIYMSKSRDGLFPGNTTNAKILRTTTHKAIHTMVKIPKTIKVIS